MKSGVVVLGSTGSVGRSALAVLAANRDRFRLLGLAAGGNIQLLERQIAEFSPLAVSVQGEKAARDLRGRFPRLRVLHGAEGLDELVALPGCDAVLAAINGTEGMRAAVQALRLKRRLCLANKETLVAAGDIVRREAAAAGAEIVPVDSEQSAIFQCLAQAGPAGVRRVVLTASGGPFFRDPGRDLATVTVAEALAHPTWSMGRKITIDSATLMNKALEIIEAKWLFGLDVDSIEVLIHPESIIHSMVEFCDGSVVAQLGTPDMRTPIQYALTYPERRPGCSDRLDWSAIRRLHFEPPDLERFPALRLGYEAARAGGTAGAVLNAANEEAVQAFREARIPFGRIVSTVEQVFRRHRFLAAPTMEDLLAADRWARQEVSRCLDA